MSNIAFTVDVMVDQRKNGRFSPQIYIMYPDKIKIISQVKSIDAHSLIGNIGGYIGLFLGRFFIRISKANFLLLVRLHSLVSLIPNMLELSGTYGHRCPCHFGSNVFHKCFFLLELKWKSRHLTCWSPCTICFFICN